MANILIINGPNLNLLGIREPHTYGPTSLETLNTYLQAKAKTLGHHLTVLQSNEEHTLINKIQSTSLDGTHFLLFNPAAFTHTSIALRDALLAVKTPFIEIHISNIYAREPFRATSYFSDIAVGVISGLGIKGYEFALEAAHMQLTATRTVGARHASPAGSSIPAPDTTSI